MKYKYDEQKTTQKCEHLSRLAREVGLRAGDCSASSKAEKKFKKIE